LEHEEEHFHVKGAPDGNLVVANEKLPRACAKLLLNYRRCKIINGSEKCSTEGQDILNVCPQWALETITEKKR